MSLVPVANATRPNSVKRVGGVAVAVREDDAPRLCEAVGEVDGVGGDERVVVPDGVLERVEVAVAVVDGDGGTISMTYGAHTGGDEVAPGHQAELGTVMTPPVSNSAKPRTPLVPCTA